MASEAEKTFHHFAAYGESSSSGNEIHNKNFSKMCKDCGIMDGKIITSTDVDIVFSKVKKKNARSINWTECQMALKEMGQKKFKDKSPEEALQSMFALMVNKVPVASGVTKTVAVGGVDRLTDTSKYTGSTLHLKQKIPPLLKETVKRAWLLMRGSYASFSHSL
uniref:Tubulin polymerization promoting protein family member 2 n=1 Tax=Monodelphis domestica TaxID=13616 RepID=A0A5F8GVW7_MONDO